jgi:hypothetical protein
MVFCNKDGDVEDGAMANILETLAFNREEFEVGNEVDAENNKEQNQDSDAEIEHSDKGFRLTDLNDSESTKDDTSQLFEVFFDEDNESLAEFIPTSDPDNHLEILSTLLRHIEKPKGFTNRLLFKYEDFIKKHGVQAIKDQIWQGLKEDVRTMLEGSQINLTTLQACKKTGAQFCRLPGVYAHVMYDPKNPTDIGIYIGSAKHIASRIKEHSWPRQSQGSGKGHLDAWKRLGIRDFWMVIGTLENFSSKDVGQLPMLLNIFEMYGMLLFRTLSWPLLQKYLPKDAKIRPFVWTGLNTANPLNQFRNGMKPYLSRLGENIRHKAKSFWANFHCQSKEADFVIRAADPLKGDKQNVEVICKTCRDPRSCFFNQTSRYEITKGRYIITRTFCSCCQSPNLSSFVPVNSSIQSVSYGAVMERWIQEKAAQGDIVSQAYWESRKSQKRKRVQRRSAALNALQNSAADGDENALAKLAAQDAKSLFRRQRNLGIQTVEELRQLGRDDLKYWINDKGFTAGCLDRKARLLALAEAILNPSKAATLEKVRKTKSRQSKPHIQRCEEPIQPQTREDLSRMNWVDLTSWIHNRGVAIKTGSKKKERLTIAETIWDLAQEPFTSSQVNHGLMQQHIRKRFVTPQERKDLRRMQRKDLMMWIRSKGIAVAGQAPKKIEMIKQAEEIWDLAGQEPPQSSFRIARPFKILELGSVPRAREDLNAMRADDLRIWIQSQGHKIEWKPKPKRLGLLRQAQKIWDNRGQQSFQSNASRVTRKKGFTYLQCRGDIDQMNAVTLVSWIRSKGYIVTGQQRVKACVLAQAKKIWKEAEPKR